MMKPAVVLLSGGLDSATCLAIARSQGFACYCLSFNYGQRHLAELEAAERVALALGATEHRILNLGLAQFGGGSALTDSTIAVPVAGIQPGIPVTYVPARNTIMLSLALAWAEVLGSRDIFVGAMRSTTPVTRIAGRNTSLPSKKWPIWRPKRVSKARAASCRFTRR